ncbi:hypothetical protein LJR029_005474 [Caballeronia sp. LjRoot29]|uniref:hypothetical protein n=1 Tax=Caballeronia sp. LjRoot29 TaxID=3342315 RepID=UPI003ECF26DC
MAKTKAVVPSKPAEKRADMTVEARESESGDKTLARLAGSATFRAALTENQLIGTTMGGAELGLFEVNAALTERFLEVTRDGNMAKTEAMLLAQAHTCEAIFHEFARRALRSNAMPNLEAYMRMALKAQQQSASTLRVLGELKAPRAVSFVKQQNVAHGNQQVNNGVEPVARAHGESGDQPNELLVSEQYGTQTLDARTKGRAGRRNPALAAVATVDGAAD